MAIGLPFQSTSPKAVGIDTPWVKEAIRDIQLSNLMELLREEPAGGSPFAPVRRHRAMQNAALAQRKADALQAYMLPLQVRALEAQVAGDEAKAAAAQAELKAFQGQLAGMNEVGVGLFGAGGGNKLAFLTGQSGAIENLMRAQYANTESKIAATKLAEDELTPVERIDQAMQAVGFAPGEWQEMMRLNRIGANAQQAEAFNVQSSIDGTLNDFNARARMMTGNPRMELFTRDDTAAGLGEYQRLIDQEGLTTDQALLEVMRLSEREAKRRFIALTAPAAVEQALGAAGGQSPMGRADAAMAGFGSRLSGMLPPGLITDMSDRPGMAKGRMRRAMDSADAAMSRFGDLFGMPDLSKPVGP